MNLGENIFKYRSRSRMSQGDLANALDISRQSVSKWENNSAVPELDKLMKMAALFEVSLDELVYSESRIKYQQSSTQIHTSDSTRTNIGLILLSFGLVAFLLSVFWGNQLRMGEEAAELLSMSVIFISIIILATYNFKVLGFCAMIHLGYSIICFGIMNVTSIYNYIFVSFTSVVIFVWFICLGLHMNNKECSDQ